MPSTVASILQGAAKRIKTAERSQLVEIHDHYERMGNEFIRRQIIDNNRIDILAGYVLKYEVKPFHMRMLQWQFRYPDNLQLSFRGGGKTTVCTVVKAIHLLIKDRDLRICLASKTKSNSETFLKEIKGHLEGNEKLITLFGEFYDPARVVKWDNSEIEIVGRSRVIREASITCTGVDSAVVSRHYDVIISDDLVDEDNARTKHMRDKTKVWYYKTLDPTLMPPDPNRPHVGEHHRLGTRYHFDDLYGHLKDGSSGGSGGELKRCTQVIPALDEKGCSPWPEVYPPKFFLEKKRKSGTVIFNAQFQCDTEAMKGEVFQFDDCQQVEVDSPEWPADEDLKIFMGVDLAITEKEKNDQFAIIVIGVKGKVMVGKDPEAVYLLDFFAQHMRFPAQKPKILEMYDKWDPIQVGIESNAFQAASYQTLKEDRPSGRFLAIQTDKDKMTRGHKLSGIFEAGKCFFKKGLAGPVIDQLVLFPGMKLKDLFDAYDLAVRVSKRRKRRERGLRKEPGVI